MYPYCKICKVNKKETFIYKTILYTYYINTTVFKIFLYNIDRISHFHYFILKAAVLQKAGYNFEILTKMNTFWLPFKTQLLQVCYRIECRPLEKCFSFFMENQFAHGEGVKMHLKKGETLLLYWMFCDKPDNISHSAIVLAPLSLNY